MASSRLNNPQFLQSWWKLEGDALDSMGRNNGTWVGNEAYVPGPINNHVVAHFDRNSYINC